ncbi:MAG: hypothetical protein LBF23_01640 [Endomicrobium sp.]|jgi:hypothetical protein|nr:hypothetical protein [Endomicrobium sp.]
MERLYFLVFVTAMFFLVGCVHRVTDFTIISTKNVELSKAPNLARGEKVKGCSKPFCILGVPLGEANMKTAIDRAIEKNKDGIALLDGVVYYKGWTAILFGRHGYEVEGTILESK